MASSTSNEDFGLKIAHAGVPIQTAGDYQLLFSSSWPVLKYLKKVYIRSGQESVSHDTGFVPLVIMYTASDVSSAWVDIRSNPPEYAIAFTFNEDIITLDTEKGFQNSSNYIIYVFNLDITKNYTAPIIHEGGGIVEGYDPNFGIKIVREGKDIDSKDLRDFILHSRTITPMVHSVSYQENPGETFSVTYDLDYAPVCFAFIQRTISSNSINQWQPLGASSLATNLRFDLNRQTKTASIVGMESSFEIKAASIVILKNPFLLRDSQRIVYNG